MYSTSQMCPKNHPDEEGIETPRRPHMIHIRPCPKNHPDEEGIETDRTDDGLIAGRSPKNHPDEEGIETLHPQLSAIPTRESEEPPR